MVSFGIHSPPANTSMIIRPGKNAQSARIISRALAVPMMVTAALHP
jgi:hypothetical protein